MRVVAGGCTSLALIPTCPLGWYPGAQHPGSRWRKWGGDCGTKEEALAVVLDWMAIEHKKAVTKMPITVNEDMFDDIMDSIPLPSTVVPPAGPKSKTKAKDSAAKGRAIARGRAIDRGRAIGRGRPKGRGRSHIPGPPKRGRRKAISPWMGSSSSEDSDTSVVLAGLAMALLPTATEHSPTMVTSPTATPRATPSKAQPAKAIPAKAIPPKAKSVPAPGSNEDMVRQAKAELRKPRKPK